jgi:hypothetical protein
MPFGLQPKDDLAIVLSVVALLVSGITFGVNFGMTRRMANRSIYVDGQRFLIEICKQLMDAPLLWCIYDDDPLEKRNKEAMSDLLFQAKLRAFAHLHLNMFEIVLVEARHHRRREKGKSIPNLARIFLRHAEAVAPN